jgi:ABC-type Zn2+ transport system substrate-binding protein/surface adhesin
VKPSLNSSKYGLVRIGVAAATLAFAAMVCVAPMHSAVADDRGGDHDQDFDHDHDHDHDQSRGHEWRDKHVQGHRYRYPVYAPPSLYYPQPASTGITLVFPVDIR